MKSLDNVTFYEKATAGQTAQLYTGTITGIKEELFFINDELLSRQADGLGIRLKVGDVVSYLETSDEAYIVNLLVAAPREDMGLRFPCADGLTISAERIDLLGQQTISLRALQELSLVTSRTLKICCQNLFQTVIASAVNVMGSWIQKCEQASVETKGIMRSNAGSQIITADEDLRLDAKRINMG